MTDAPRRMSRAGLLRAAVGGGALVAGGAALADRTGGGTSFAAQAGPDDAGILNFFLLLEYVQEAFYREAVRGELLQGDLLTYAEAAGEQESEHVAFLAEQLGAAAEGRPDMRFDDALTSPERFRDASIELEELALAGYIGQGANLSRKMVRPVATLVSVEARQVAWVRDIAGLNPAPRAADPAHKAQQVTARLRQRGYLA